MLCILVSVLLLVLSPFLCAARPSSVVQWSVADVQSWLQELSVTAAAEEEWRDVADAFAEHKVDGRVLMRLGPEELEALQSSSSADVSLLIAAVQALRDTESASVSAQSAASHPSRRSESVPHQIADLSSFTAADRERIQTLEAFLQFQPADVPSLLQLAHIYLRSQNTAPRAKQLIDQADEASKKDTGAAGSNPDVLAANGDFFRLYGQSKRALGFYTRALQQDPLAGGDGAEIRLHLASVLFDQAHALAESSDSTLEAKRMLERMVNALCEALILMPRPDFQPRLTPHQATIHAALTPQEANTRVGDIEVELRDRYDTAKLLLVQAYLQLSRMYEGQARAYLAQLKAHPEFAAHVVQLDDSPRSSIPPPALGSEQREEFERVQGHMAHLFAMAYAYAARIVDTMAGLASPAATAEAREDLLLFRDTMQEAKMSMERLQKQWVDPLARQHAEMMHEQMTTKSSGSGMPLESGYDLFTQYNAHLSNATQLIRAAQFQPPNPTRGAFVHQKMIASMLHAHCKTAAARELISSIREPARDARTNQTLVSLREEEYYLRSSAYPALFTSRKEIRTARAAWETRIDRLLAEARNTTALVTARLEMTDEQIARFPSLEHALRWGPADQIERSRFALNSLPSHGLNNRRLATKLAQLYLALTTPLPSREDPQPKSWLSFEAPGLSKGAQGEYEDAQVRATFSALGSGSGTAATTVESIRARPAGSKIKIAFVFALHPSLPSLSWLAGYLLHLPRDRFEVCMFEINLAGSGDSAEWVLREDALGEGTNSLYARVHQQLSSEGMWRNLQHRDVVGARSEIMLFAPEAIVFSGLGHDPLSFFLAFSRLAPVQSVFLPATRDTSGIPHTIDFGIGFRSMFAEEAEAQKGFSERLQLLPGIGWIPRPVDLPPSDLSKTREDYELSNTQLTQRWHVQFNDSDMHAATGGSLFSEASARRRPLFLVASDNPAAYSPVFLSALARILAASPSAVLVVLLDPGVALSPLAESAGEEQMGLLYAGAKNQCKDIVLDQIEASMAGEKSIADHPDARLQVAEGADFVAQLTRAMPPSSQGRTPLLQSGRVRFLRRPHHTKALRQLMNVADVLLQSFPMDGQLKQRCAVCASAPANEGEAELVGAVFCCACCSDLSDALAALSVNLPTVYLSSPASSAGHMTHALYSEMKLPAESHTGARSVNAYVDVAVKLGKDETLRNKIRAEIASRKDAIYERPEAIAEFFP